MLTFVFICLAIWVLHQVGYLVPICKTIGSVISRCWSLFTTALVLGWVGTILFMVGGIAWMASQSSEVALPVLTALLLCSPALGYLLWKRVK